MKVAITGKSGILSQELQRIYSNLVILDSFNYNITDPQTTRKIMEINPDIIIHAGAVTNSTIVKNNPILAINTNITDRGIKDLLNLTSLVLWYNTNITDQGIKI